MPDLNNAASVSIVVPFHNEEPNIVEMYGRLHAVMEALGRNHQFVFVDDGSTDLTYKLLKELAVIDPRVTVVRLRRNFGQTGALAAGFAHSTGDYVIAMDGDLQHDPAEIPAFLEKIEEGYDIVSGWRSHSLGQFAAPKDSVPLCQLADGEAQRRQHSRLWDHVQGVSGRPAPTIASLWRNAPVHPSPGFILRSLDL